MADPGAISNTCQKKHRSPRFERRNVDLVDQFGPSQATVLRPERFCNPVDKNGEGILDPQGHLNCYKIRERGFARVEVVVENQFGEQRVMVSRPDTLCVPAVKDGIGDLEDLNIRHFKCYRAWQMGPRRFQSIPGVLLEDQFELKSATLIKLRLLCTPVDKNGEDPTAPDDANHLTCYKIKQDQFRPRSVEVADQFGREDLSTTGRVDCGRARMLCVPSNKRLASPSGAFLNTTGSVFD